MHMGYRMGAGAFLVAAGLALGAPAHAIEVTYEAVVNGAQEVPPTPSPATGQGTFVIDTDANTIDYNITFTDSLLLAPETAAHIHCCAPPGVNAGVIIPLPLGNPKIGQGTYTEANEAGILNGLSYVNIHTTAFPGGEIRGQIVAPPTATDQTSWGLIKALYR